MTRVTTARPLPVTNMGCLPRTSPTRSDRGHPRTRRAPGRRARHRVRAGAVDRGVRVLLKMARQFRLELLDPVIDLADLANHRADSRGERTAHHGRHLELRGPPRGAVLGGALPARWQPRRKDLGDAQPGLAREGPPLGAREPPGARRSRLVCRVRSQMNCWWARARMRTAAASSLSPATSRWL